MLTGGCAIEKAGVGGRTAGPGGHVGSAFKAREWETRSRTWSLPPLQICPRFRRRRLHNESPSIPERMSLTGWEMGGVGWGGGARRAATLLVGRARPCGA